MCGAPSPVARLQRRAGGFSLIEILIVVAIVAILAAIAWPAYNRYVFEARRADGVAALLALQLAQERHRVVNPSFTNNLLTLGLSATSPDGHYAIAITAASATGFTATATAQGAQANDSAACRVLTLTQDRNNLTRSPADCWRR